MKGLDELGEVIVVDNNSSDNTATLAKEKGARVVFEPINNIAKSRNKGGVNAHGKFLIFIDADTLLNTELLKQTLLNLKNKKICVGGSTLFVPNEVSVPIKLIIKSWNFISNLMSWAAGCYVYCTKKAFESVGGFDERVYASEEILFVKAVKKWGAKRNESFELIKTYPVSTSMRKLEWFSFANLLLTFLIFSIFPFAPRYKALCFFWYKRPKKVD
jgi:glycosyltransferase involved in cell wall biosynthesis